MTISDKPKPGQPETDPSKRDVERDPTFKPTGADVIARTEATIVGTSPVERTEAGEALDFEHELMTINMGPHHPATHGVLRLLVSLQGETVIDLKPVMGYVHTGIEKSCEDKAYWKVIPYVERMDYLSYFFNMQAFCGAIEQMLELEIPARAQYLRIIHMELNRIHSHLVWLGTSALDLGAISMFWYCFRERDQILDLFEMSTGQRMHTRYFQVGGVFEDIPLGFEAKLREFCEQMPARIGQYEALLDRNEIFLQRTRGIGIVSRQRLLELGVTGPLLRATGEPWDLRKVSDYLPYGDFDFQIPVGTVGDNYDRYRVRIQEMYESVKIVTQALDGLPEGPWVADDRKVVLPPRHELSTSMEALIHHFKLVTEGFRVPPGEIYNPVESPRGELGCYVLADGSAKPARVHFRDPSFINLQALREMCVGGYIADLIVNLAMLDPILGGIDR
ncbi:MAG: NADH-quinone oxidoreductase subunit D [Solirubrobacterales bacterium]|nr:NADH-quinone oxidoreductase subunit D [Solirubrobacterales bacterium]